MDPQGNSEHGIREATYLLRKALTLHGARVGSATPWTWESARWHELVFSILRTVDGPENDAETRLLVAQLSDLGLLEIPTLASCSKNGGQLDMEDLTMRRLLSLVTEHGFAADEAERLVTAIYEMASAFARDYESQPQKFLRKHAESMLEELLGMFSFSSMDRQQAGEALTFWLQNAAAMPISLINGNMVIFCGSHKISPQELIQAGDDMGLNLAVIDDLVDEWMHSSAASSSTPDE